MEVNVVDFIHCKNDYLMCKKTIFVSLSFSSDALAVPYVLFIVLKTLLKYGNSKFEPFWMNKLR